MRHANSTLDPAPEPRPSTTPHPRADYAAPSSRMIAREHLALRIRDLAEVDLDANFAFEAVDMLLADALKTVRVELARPTVDMVQMAGDFFGIPKNRRMA